MAENDNKKVSAIHNEIHGKRHDGSPVAGMPALFGMNFQTVSVGQEVAHDNGRSHHQNTYRNKDAPVSAIGRARALC